MLSTILIIFFFLLACVLLLWQVSNIIAVYYGSLFVKADKENVKKILQRFSKRDLIFYDLGCGNGDILLLANDFEMRAIGYEVAPFYYIQSKLRTFFKKNISVKYANILKTDLSQADIIYCYLLPPLLEKLSIKFKKEIKKNAVVISAGFPINNLKIVRKLEINSRKFFVYKNI